MRTLHAIAVHAAILCLVAGCAAPTGPAPGQGTLTPGPTSGSTASTGTAASSGGLTYEVPRSVHEAAWLCQTAITVDDLTAGGTDDQQCKVTLSFTGTAVTVQSTGLPNHDYESGGGCCAKTHSFSNTFPLKPQLAAKVTYAPTRGQTALAVNGVSIYGPEDADSQDVVVATYSDPNAQPRLNMCDAHSDPQGTYHYHADGNCMHVHPANGDWSKYSFEGSVDRTAHAKILGFAPDGFPIYGTYGYGSDGQTVQEVTSSYRLKSGKTGSGGIADYQYVAGLGDLDECNGRTSATPEFPNGIYHYYSTRHNGEGDWGFPYFPLCYKGVVTSTGTGASTGGQGGMGGSQSQPPSGSSGTTSCPPPPQQGQPPPTGPPPQGCPRPP